MKNVPAQCPKCGSDELRRAHRHGLRDWIRKAVLHRRPYRCLRCNYRFFGYAPGDPQNSGQVSKHAA